MEKVDEAMELAFEASSEDSEAIQSSVPAYPLDSPANTDCLTSGENASQTPTTNSSLYTEGKQVVCVLYVWKVGLECCVAS